MSERLSLRDVYGVRSNFILASHISRDAVDERFKKSLTDDQRHIIIHGASKQGKTSLLQSHLPEDRYVKIIASNEMKTRADFYNSLLVSLGAQVVASVKSTGSLGGSGEVGTRVTLTFPFLMKAEGTAKAKGEAEGEKEVVSKAFNVNLSIVQDVKSVLDSVLDRSKFIVIENFHYFRKEFQRDFAQDLRAWNDFGYRFVILGIWSEHNYLKGFNDELNDRVFEIPVEPWHNNDLRLIARTGGKKMGTMLSPALLDRVIESSFGSVAVFQDLLKKVHELSGIEHSQDGEAPTVFADLSIVEMAIKVKAGEYKDGYLNHLRDLAGKNNNKENALFLLYYLVKFFFKKNVPATGVSRDNLLSFFEHDIKHRDVERKILIPALHQQLNNLRNVLDELNWTNKIYYVGDRLYILDPLLRFYLSYTNRDEDFETIPEPWS